MPPIRLALVFLIGATAMATAAPTCREEMGESKSRVLVERCTDISPATHPPCNASNACSMIEDEIRRGCRFAGTDAPAWCRPYK
jgi:hypothetical protein